MNLIRTHLASLIGRALHHLAAASRRLIGSRSARDAQTVAVLCDSFVRYSVAQSIGLKNAGADVVFYYVDRLNEFANDPADREPYLARLEAAGIPAVPLPPRQLRALHRQIGWLHRDLRRRAVGALVVQAHLDPRYATLGFRFPVALVVHDPRPHSGDYESSFPWPVRALSRFAEVTSGAILVHSERLKSQLFPLLSAIPVGVYPHGADVQDDPAPLVTPPTLVLVGRLMEYKGIDTALDAFDRVRRIRPDCGLILAGRGNMGDAIRAAHRPGVELFDRYIPEEELDALIRDSRLVLLPYKDATQSGVGLLSIGEGVPCIVSDVGALPDLVAEVDGSLVVPPDDPARLADAILNHLDHTIESRAAILEHARHRFAWPIVGATLLAELRRLGLR